jgi:hypothetical protein
MARIYEGKIIISLDDLWNWLREKYIATEDYITFGVPSINNSEKTIEIDYAGSSEGDPKDWVRKSLAIKQWEFLEKQKSNEK